MEIARLALPRPVAPLRPAALALALLLNGGLLVIFGLSRQHLPHEDTSETAIDILLVETEPPVESDTGPVPTETPEPASNLPQRESVDTGPSRDKAPTALRPGRLPLAENDTNVPEPALWSLVCRQLTPELRDLRAECREEGDPFAARVGRVRAGAADQSIVVRPLGDMIGGRFAGRDRYQIEVMLGLRSTSLGTKYHLPVDHGPADEPTDLSNSDDVFGPSPIPDG